jgi:hypothetical protein
MEHVTEPALVDCLTTRLADVEVLGFVDRDAQAF